MMRYQIASLNLNQISPTFESQQVFLVIDTDPSEFTDPFYAVDAWFRSQSQAEEVSAALNGAAS